MAFRGKLAVKLRGCRFICFIVSLIFLRWIKGFGLLLFGKHGLSETCPGFFRDDGFVLENLDYTSIRLGLVENGLNLYSFLGNHSFRNPFSMIAEGRVPCGERSHIPPNKKWKIIIIKSAKRGYVRSQEGETRDDVCKFLWISIPGLVGKQGGMNLDTHHTSKKDHDDWSDGGSVVSAKCWDGCLKPW